MSSQTDIQTDRGFSGNLKTAQGLVYNKDDKTQVEQHEVR